MRCRADDRHLRRAVLTLPLRKSAIPRGFSGMHRRVQRGVHLLFSISDGGGKGFELDVAKGGDQRDAPFIDRNSWKKSVRYFFPPNLFFFFYLSMRGHVCALTRPEIIEIVEPASPDCCLRAGPAASATVTVNWTMSCHRRSGSAQSCNLCYRPSDQSHELTPLWFASIMAETALVWHHPPCMQPSTVDYRIVLRISPSPSSKPSRGPRPEPSTC